VHHHAVKRGSPAAAGVAPIAHPQDTQAQRNYLQTYTYDMPRHGLRLALSPANVISQ